MELTKEYYPEYMNYCKSEGENPIAHQKKGQTTQMRKEEI